MMFRALAVSTLLGASSACVNPTGLGSIVDFNLLSLPTGPGGPGIFASAIMQAIPALASYETPVQARLVLATVTPIFNAAAAFEPNALDIFGRADVSEDRRRCAGTDPTLFDQHRQVTLAYAVLWSMQLNLGSSPSAPPSAFEGLAISWGLNLDICDSEDCSDITTPWGLADSLVKDSIDVYSRDGWNADGSLNADFNRVPYSDWRNRPYEPSKGPFKWQPLQETNGLGFSFRQEHVTPHIGFTAKSFFVGDQKVCSRRLRNPRYKYNQEIRKLLQRSAALDDRQKMEIEFFDSKFTSLVPLTVQYFARRGISLDSFEWILYDTATIAVIYEAVLQAWRVKVQLDLIRPTTLVQRRKKGQTVIAYQGPASGGTIGPISGEDWQPYIRVSKYDCGKMRESRSFTNFQLTHVFQQCHTQSTPRVLHAFASPLHVPQFYSSERTTSLPSLVAHWLSLSRLGLARLNPELRLAIRKCLSTLPGRRLPIVAV